MAEYGSLKVTRSMAQTSPEERSVGGSAMEVQEDLSQFMVLREKMPTYLSPTFYLVAPQSQKCTFMIPKAALVITFIFQRG